MAKLHLNESDIRTPKTTRRRVKHTRASRKAAANFGLYPCLRCGEYTLTKWQYEKGEVCARCYGARR